MTRALVLSGALLAPIALFGCVPPGSSEGGGAVVHTPAPEQAPPEQAPPEQAPPEQATPEQAPPPGDGAPPAEVVDPVELYTLAAYTDGAAIAIEASYFDNYADGWQIEVYLASTGQVYATTPRVDRPCRSPAQAYTRLPVSGVGVGDRATVVLIDDLGDPRAVAEVVFAGPVEAVEWMDCDPEVFMRTCAEGLTCAPSPHASGDEPAPLVCLADD